MRFTEHDLEVIAKHVKQNPTNLRNSFKDAADELGRNWKSVKNVWYSNLRYSKHLFGLQAFKNNVKNIYSSKEAQMERYSRQLKSTKKTAVNKDKIAYLKFALKSLAKSL